jgi:signal peptidase I
LNLGATRARKPSIAANLSLVFVGLGQVYCGVLQRGVLHMCVFGVVMAGAMLAMATGFAKPPTVCWTAGLLLVAITCYSGADAYRLARRTREDYRLKEYNTFGFYTALCGLFMIAVVGLALVVRAYFVHMFVMAGDSMAPTLESGDRILVRKDAFREEDPVRNDLVAFLNPSDRRQTWVKRVIGLPGDQVEMKAGQVLVNGKPIDEVATVQGGSADTAPVTVPENHCFLLGDNRVNSRDSRLIGTVPMIALVGKVVFVR